MLEMNRRLASLSLLFAWLCASGAMLDVAQVFAWGRMFAGYVKSESIVAAAKETFDPAKPCEICGAVNKAREASSSHGTAVPSAGTDKMVMIFDPATASVVPRPAEAWPADMELRAAQRAGEVPVPPPRVAPGLAA